jgi:hypothetical protein
MPFFVRVARLGELVPRNDVDVIHSIVLLCSAIDGNRQVRNRRSALHVPDFRIADEVAYEDNAIVVSHRFLSFALRAPLDDRKRVARTRSRTQGH